MADRLAIERIVLAHVANAAEDAAPAVALRYPVGSSGIAVDIAIAADEFIGVLIRGTDDPLGDLARELGVCRRYFDRVVAVVAPCHVGAALASERHGAALWTVGASGALVEHRAGELAQVGVAALFDLMPPDARARLVRPLIPRGAIYDRKAPGLSPLHVRTAFASAMHRLFEPVGSVQAAAREMSSAKPAAAHFVV